MKSQDSWIRRDVLFAVSGAIDAVCQMSGQRASYFSKLFRYIADRCPFSFLVIMIIGSILASCTVTMNGITVILGIGIVFFGNGLIYSSAVRYIDEKIESRYRLTCLSFLLLFSDIICHQM